MSFRRRQFPEVLENLLTSVTKGVAGETQPFPPRGATAPPYRHTLQQPTVAEVVSVYGSRDDQSHQFRKDVDYKLLDDKQTIEWQKGAELPDPGSLLEINYYPQSAQPVLTDIQTGSIIRTLSETVALEVARLYAQLDAVYQAGFVDTASGKALDNVVALLGITRVLGGRPAGEVEFTRAPNSLGTITIPAGTRVAIADGSVQYGTTAEVTMAVGQNTIRVVARDLQPNPPQAAGTLVLLPIPIDGIASVTNPAPTAIATQDETDDQLRTRAKNFLHGSERATLGAINQAIASQGLTADVVEVENTPGVVEITVHTEAISPDQQQRLMQAINAVRPAGVLVRFKGVAPPRKVNLELLLTSAKGLLEQDLLAAQHTIHDKLQDYFARLSSKDAGSLTRIVGLVLSVPGIEDVKVLSATWTVDGVDVNVLDSTAGQLTIAGFPKVLGELSLIDPNLPTQLSVVVSCPANSAQPDNLSIQSALNTALSYLNNLNTSALAPGAPAAEQAKRAISFGKLLFVIPLPGKPGQTLDSYDNATPLPTLPDENSIKPYSAKFVFTQESGLSSILSRDADSYTLTPSERLSLSGVEISKEAQ